MNIINQTLKLFMAIPFLMAISNPLLAFGPSPFLDFTTVSDTVFSCNDLVHVSVNENCEADINADGIVEGFDGDFDEFDLTVKFFFDTIPLPIPSEFVGETLTIIATHMPSGIECWGLASIEDKWAPQLTCSDYDLPCFENPASFPLPTVTDNCGTPNLIVIGENINASDVCVGVTITRSYVAVDGWGNESAPCSQTFTLHPVDFPDLPKDTSWSCETLSAHPNITQAKRLTGSLFSTGSGAPDVTDNPFCGYNVVHQDQVASGCGETFTILRTWTVINWCTGEIITVDAEGDDLLQLIKIYDDTPPQIEMEPYTVNANVTGTNSQECKSMDYLPPANVSDNCHLFTQRILTPVGEAEYVIGTDGTFGGIIPAPGLEFGEHTIIYEAEDECGNVDSIHVTVTVADMTAPVTICDEITTVSIGALGEAEVLAEVFDDGSYDNCCLDSFLVRRMSLGCVASDSLFGETVTLCCADVGDTVTVVFRAKDCFGNTNDCMVSVLVEDKVPVEMVSCPPPVSIDCGFYTDSLEIPLSQNDTSVLGAFGWPEFLDNCEVVYENILVDMNIDQCQSGTIVRHWQVTDTGGNGSLNCSQTITVEHTSDWVVSFPDDVLVVCGDSIPETGEPSIFYENCELVAISYEDEIFTVVPDACFKIVRTWVVINWCAVGSPIEDVLEETPESSFNFDLDLDGDRDERTFQDGLNADNFDENLNLNGAQPDGFISYQQIIKVNDPVAPVVECEPEIEICILGTPCTADFSLPLPGITDCSPETTVSAIGDLGEGTGPYTDVPPGIYEMTYQVSDNCGNTGFCQTEIEVRDCKAPTPKCKNGVIIVLCNGVVENIPPDILNDGSFDNCSDDLTLSFSSDMTDTLIMVDCGDLGVQLMQLWVTDEAGNQAFCQTFVVVENPCGDCQGPPLVGGMVTTPELEPMNGVLLTLNGTMEQDTTTFAEGEYEFRVEYGGDYTLTPGKDSLPLNGVTTFDLVLISQHILGVQPLDSPYKIIAADANQSNSVTTADVLLLRKIILQIETNFPGGETWRFVEKAYSFPEPLNPFSEEFPEIINLNNLTSDELEADFIGIKLGDVNGSANPQL